MKAPKGLILMPKSPKDILTNAGRSALLAVWLLRGGK